MVQTIAYHHCNCFKYQTAAPMLLTERTIFYQLLYSIEEIKIMPVMIAPFKSYRSKIHWLLAPRVPSKEN